MIIWLFWQLTNTLIHPFLWHLIEKTFLNIFVTWLDLSCDFFEWTFQVFSPGQPPPSPQKVLPLPPKGFQTGWDDDVWPEALLYFRSELFFSTWLSQVLLVIYVVFAMKILSASSARKPWECSCREGCRLRSALRKVANARPTFSNNLTTLNNVFVEEEEKIEPLIR